MVQVLVIARTRNEPKSPLVKSKIDVIEELSRKPRRTIERCAGIRQERLWKTCRGKIADVATRRSISGRTKQQSSNS